MLKALVGALVAANLAFFAWSEGAFDGLIGAPAWRSTGDREPERLKRQVHADRIRVLPAGAASQAAAALASAPTACLEVGPFPTGAVLDAAKTAVLDIVPVSALEVLQLDQPAVWGVYMGRYAAQGAMQRKEDELRRHGVPFDEVSEPESVAPGLMLGRFAERETAIKALAELAARGVRSARVIQLVEASSAAHLRVARADASTTARLRELANGRPFDGRAFTNCTLPP